MPRDLPEPMFIQFNDEPSSETVPRIRIPRDRSGRIARFVRDDLLRGPLQHPDPNTSVTPSTLTLQDVSFNYFIWQEGALYGDAISKAYGFFSRHADRRYSEITLANLQRAAELYHRYAGTDGGAEVLNREAPVIAVAEMPYTYDEETEVKRGGITGMIVCWPNLNFKSILAVHGSARRVGVARTLWRDVAMYRIQRMNFWVGRNNFVGQHWLLSMGFMPTAINSRGAIRYAISDEEE